MLLPTRPAEQVDTAETIRRALGNLCYYVTKLTDAPMSAQAHLDKAIRLLADATPWRPPGAEEEDVILSAMAADGSRPNIQPLVDERRRILSQPRMTADDWRRVREIDEQVAPIADAESCRTIQILKRSLENLEKRVPDPLGDDDDSE